MIDPVSITGNFSFPTSIRFGPGRIAELAEACAAAAITKPLFVTDREVAILPIARTARGVLTDHGVVHGLFTRVDPNPNESNLAAGIAAYRAGEHDGVVAFGGGSALDLGKLVAFMAGQERPVWDFEDVDDWWTRADADAIAPIVAVPTTAGTGSEVGRAGVLTNSETHEKKIIFHPKVLPTQVICDPELTLEMPRSITAGTGMDAFAHCLEAYCSPHFHPQSAGIAAEGLRLVNTYLPGAYADGSDLEARAQVMAAALMGAVAFQKGLGAIHALSHPIGAVHGTHHGTTNAVVMPHVLRFNRPAIEDKMARLAAYLGIEGGFDGIHARVVELNQMLGIPKTLAELGVAAPNVDMLVEMALRDPSVGGNPVPMTAENTRSLLEACL